MPSVSIEQATLRLLFGALTDGATPSLFLDWCECSKFENLVPTLGDIYFKVQFGSIINSAADRNTGL